MSPSRNQRGSHERQTRREQERQRVEGFECRHCGMYVSGDPTMSGVQNRNHCPYCLWSRHLDSRVAGDRLAGCRATMQPLGLTTKRSRNKYAQNNSGELMLIHRCTVCDKVSINRIAADDNVAVMLELFEHSYADDTALKAELAALGVSLLTPHESELVRQRLLGQPVDDEEQD